MPADFHSLKSLFRNVPIWGWLLFWIFLSSVLFFKDLVPAYDDWLYLGNFSGAHQRLDSWWNFPRWWGSHWLTTNGRFGNLVIAPLLALPDVIRTILFSIAVTGLYALAVLNTRVRKGWVPVALCAGICFFLPWWDYMTIYDCQTNYVWGSVLVLGATLCLFDTSSRYSFWKCALMFVTGFSHEAASLPLLFGIGAYWMVARPKFSRAQLRMITFFTLGTVLVVFSPGIIGRATAPRTPDDSHLWIFLKSDIIAGLLWLAIAAGFIIPRSRGILTEYFRHPHSIFIWAAGVSAAISTCSGIVGRSGWFAELYAMIAIAAWLGNVSLAPRISLARLLALLVIAQLAVTSYWQWRFNRQHQQFVKEFITSGDGVVYIPGLLYDTDAPWTALNKVKGIPDIDDIGLRESLTWYFRSDSVVPLAVDAEAGHHLPLRADSVTLLNGDRLLKELPKGATFYQPTATVPPFYVYNDNGRRRIAVALGSAYYSAPLVLDPGDRLPTSLFNYIP